MEKGKNLAGHHSNSLLSSLGSLVFMHSQNIFCRGLFYQLKTIVHILVDLYINFSCKSTTHFLHRTQVCSSIFFPPSLSGRLFKVFFPPCTRLMQMFSADALLKTHARKLTLQFCNNWFRTK